MGWSHKHFLSFEHFHKSLLSTNSKRSLSFVVAFQSPKSVSRPSPLVVLAFRTRPPSCFSYTTLFVPRTRYYSFFVHDVIRSSWTTCFLVTILNLQTLSLFLFVTRYPWNFFNISSLTCLSIDWSKDQLRVSYYVMAFRFSCHSWLSQYHVFTYNPFWNSGTFFTEFPAKSKLLIGITRCVSFIPAK